MIWWILKLPKYLPLSYNKRPLLTFKSDYLYYLICLFFCIQFQLVFISPKLICTLIYTFRFIWMFTSFFSFFYCFLLFSLRSFSFSNNWPFFFQWWLISILKTGTGQFILTPQQWLHHVSNIFLFVSELSSLMLFTYYWTMAHNYSYCSFTRWWYGNFACECDVYIQIYK